VFGSAAFVEEIDPFSSLTGLRSDHIAEDFDLGPSANHPNHEDVVGNVYLNSAWRALDANLARRNIPNLDIITVRPLNAVDLMAALVERKMHDALALSELQIIYFRLLNRLWQRLSSDGGIVLVEINNYIANSALKPWLLHSLLLNAIEIDFKVGRFYTTFLIRRKPDNPSVLPF
jgi:hypothetical protein